MELLKSLDLAESVLFSTPRSKKIKSAKDLKLNRFLVIYPVRIQGETMEEEVWDYKLESFRTKVEAQNFIRYYEKGLPKLHDSALNPILVDTHQSR